MEPTKTKTKTKTWAEIKIFILNVTQQKEMSNAWIRTIQKKLTKGIHFFISWITNKKYKWRVIARMSYTDRPLPSIIIVIVIIINY